MNEETGRIVGSIPPEIRRGVEAFSGETEQAVVVTLLDADEGKLAFSELQSALAPAGEEIHSQTLTNALDVLHRAGLVNKRADTAEGTRFGAYYEVSEYGERFVDGLLRSLGTVDATGPRSDFEEVDHIHNTTDVDDGSVYVESFHREDVETESPAGLTK